MGSDVFSLAVQPPSFFPDALNDLSNFSPFCAGREGLLSKTLTHERPSPAG